jgi:hypothetical protein
MESLQELNPDKDRASDAQIMFMCLHASGLTLIATSIIGYRAAAGAANPADVMLPCIYPVYWYYCRFFNCWNQAKLILKVLFSSRFDGINRSYRWFVDVCESIDLIGKTILPITFQD